MSSHDDCSGKLSHVHAFEAQQMQLLKVNFLRPRKHSTAPLVAVSSHTSRASSALPWAARGILHLRVSVLLTFAQFLSTQH